MAYVSLRARSVLLTMAKDEVSKLENAEQKPSSLFPLVLASKLCTCEEIQHLMKGNTRYYLDIVLQ